MPHQDYRDDEPVRRYDETLEPQNPPNSVVRPVARRAAVRTFVGGIALFFVIATAAFLFWSASGEHTAPEGAAQTDPSAVGTSGERTPREDTPGGFDPAGRPDDTQEEIEFRGGGEPPQGPNAGLGTTAAVTRLDALTGDSARTMTGRRVKLEDVEVEKADGSAFWVRDGDSRVAVQAAGGSPTVKAGQQVDVEGTVEAAGNEAVRIRASRIDVK
jgi:hypothetical protein